MKHDRIYLITLFFLLSLIIFLSFVLADKMIYQPPTDANATKITASWAEINASIEDRNATRIMFSWNGGANFTVMNETLRVWYNFDKRSSLGETYEHDTLVYNLANYSIHANLTNATSPTTADMPNWRPDGKFGGAFEFTSAPPHVIGESIMVGNNDYLNPYDQDFAMMFWFNCSSPLGDTDLSRKGSTDTTGNGNVWYKMEIGGYGTDDLLSLQFTSSGGGATVESTTNVCDKAWHFAVGQRRGNIAELWIDAVNQTTWTGAGSDNTIIGFCNNSANLSIGSKDVQNDDFFAGMMDEYRLYINRSFSSDEIGMMYHTNLQRYDLWNWSLWVNKTGITTKGNYTHQTCMINLSNDINCTDRRWIEKVGITIGESMPNLTVIHPLNGSIVFPDGNVSFNVSIESGNPLTVTIYATNDSSRLNESMVYRETGLSSGFIPFNYTDPITPLDDQLLVLLHLNNQSEFGEDDTVAYDFSDGKDNATLSSPVWAAGSKFGVGLNQPGTETGRSYIIDSDRVDVKNFTISFWFRRDGAGTAGGFGACYAENVDIITGKGGGGEDGGGFDSSWIIGVDRATSQMAVCFETQTGADKIMPLSTTVIETGKWYHVVYTNNFTHSALYINGSYESILATATNPAISVCNIGIGVGVETAANTIDGALNGVVDEFAIWNRTLDYDEIRMLDNLTAWGRYYYRVEVTDGANVNMTGDSFFLVGFDTEPPKFEDYPANITMEEYNSSTYIDFNFSDDVAIDEVWINDTLNFTINDEGILRNITNLAVERYIINVSINDTSGNVNSTLWQINVTAAPEAAPPEEGGGTTGGTPSEKGSAGEQTGETGKKTGPCDTEGQPFTARLFSKCKIPDNGICEDGENFLFDKDCSINSKQQLRDIFTKMWFLRASLLLLIIVMIKKNKNLPLFIISYISLLAWNGAFG